MSFGGPPHMVPLTGPRTARPGGGGFSSELADALAPPQSVSGDLKNAPLFIICFEGAIWTQKCSKMWPKSDKNVTHNVIRKTICRTTTFFVQIYGFLSLVDPENPSKPHNYQQKHMFAFFVDNRLLTPNIYKKLTKHRPQNNHKSQTTRPRKSLSF